MAAPRSVTGRHARYRAAGDIRGEAEALFWTGCFHQVVRRDEATALTALNRSLEVAVQAGDKGTMSEALRHLGIAAHGAGQLEEARQRLEESTRLRREIGLLAGAASNLIGLGYIAAAQARGDLRLPEETGRLSSRRAGR